MIRSRKASANATFSISPCNDSAYVWRRLRHTDAASGSETRTTPSVAPRRASPVLHWQVRFQLTCARSTCVPRLWTTIQTPNVYAQVPTPKPWRIEDDWVRDPGLLSLCEPQPARPNLPHGAYGLSLPLTSATFDCIIQ